jgi:cyclophilin family peptidyl-prolyl cis-trans isomerase/protein-disulfide isomerase
MPRHNQLAIAILILALLSACGASPTAAPTTQAPLEGVVDQIPAASCTAVSSADREEYLANSPFAAPSDEDWQRGPTDASLTIVEYSDFQCPFCAELSAVLDQIQAQYAVSVIYRHFPLIGSPEQPLHDKAAISMQAAEAAGKQGKFWEMHDLLFANQLEWTTMSAQDFDTWLQGAATALSLDIEQFNTDLYSEELATAAQAAWEQGQELQLGGTPYLLINGIPYSGPLDFNSLETIVKLELLYNQQFSECPEMRVEPEASYTATISTEKGDIVIELFPDVAPMAVNSFLFLAEQNWFDDVTFHRVLPGFVAQAGDPTGTGYGGPGYSFAIEVDPNVTFDRAGLLAMANSGPTSNGSQFFITLGPAEHLNGQFTIFGEVIQGMDVVENLTPRDPSQSATLPPGDLILDVSIEVH